MAPFFQIFTMFTDPITEKTVYAYLVVHFNLVTLNRWKSDQK